MVTIEGFVISLAIRFFLWVGNTISCEAFTTFGLENEAFSDGECRVSSRLVSDISRDPCVDRNNVLEVGPPLQVRKLKEPSSR